MKFRISIGILSIIGLLSVYLFQKTDLGVMVQIGDSFIERFIFNRTIRFLLNDLFMTLLIYALFEKRKFIVFAVYVQLTEVIVFLIPYFILKIYFPSASVVLTSYLHRLVMNPILLLLLIPAFYYQKKTRSMGSESK